MKGYKGFDRDLKCRGKQYKIGQTEREETAELCNKGLHYCEYPLDCFGYYPPADSRYCEVDAEEVSDKKDDDSKRVAKSLTIGAEIGIPGIAKASVEYIMGRVSSQKTNTGRQSAATNTGDRSAATNTGDWSAATNTGNWSAATNTGDQSAATNTGDWSAATNTGDWSAATNTGNWSAATNTGDQSAATVTGKGSVAVACGRRGKAKGAIGCAIVLCERDDDGAIIHIQSELIDGDKIKADTYYTLNDGVLVICEEDDCQV